MEDNHVYLSWANSVLCEVNRSVDSVGAVQDGKILYIVDGDIKSLLDVMWLLILNYGIHFIGQNAYQRSVGIGKKNLLEWCQGNWFTKLLQKFAGCHIPETEDKVTYLYKLLEEIEERYGIRRTIISPNDIIDGTVDEHTLMIYLSLLKRRIQERNRSMSEEAEARRRMSELAPTQNRESRPTRERNSSHDRGSNLQAEAEQVLLQTISGSEANNQAYGNLLERLEELSRSGRAQRVILPDLGPDAPVLMIPGQGQEVLLLFDALRRARLEVDLSMPKSNGNEEDVIELKQALASAVVENDILQAKLNNARHEIQGKLSKTNEVLDDCRRHLAKSQAENMELRTALERERERSATLEGRVREMDIVAQQARADNEELEEELDHTLSMLDRSLSETKPGIDALKQENAELHGQATVFQTENSSLKREMDELRRSHTKAVHTIRELRTCLDEAREERDDLQQRVHELERSQSESKVQSILSHYQEKGARDETEREYNSSGLSQSSDRFTRNHRRTSTRNDEVTPGNTPSKGATPNVSGIAPRVASPVRGLNYSFEEVSAPTVPSTYREIYPHRKPRYQSLSAERYASPERVESPVNFIDYPDLQHYPTKLDPVDLGDSYLSRSQQEDEGGFSRHSPPTRLSPENKKDKPAAKKKLMFTKTEAGEIARNLQREFDKEDSMLDKLRQKHSTKSWF
nr:hypothetical protein BaRGS_003293 [Batillaria attramentaria]